MLSAAAALVLYSCLAVALFIGAWSQPASRSVGVSGDAQEVMWFLAWPSFALSHAENPLFTTYIDYPGGVNLMWNSSTMLPGFVLSPVASFGGVVLAYNVLMTAGVALSAWTSYLLIRRFVSSALAAATGGLLYGFSPFMTAHALGHPQLALAFMPPVLFFLLDEILRTQRRPPFVTGPLLGLAGAAQMLIGEEMLAAAAVVGLLILCVAAGLYTQKLRPRFRHAIKALTFSAAVFGVLVAIPVGFQFLGPQRLLGRVHAPNLYVSDALNFIVPTRLLLVAPPPLTAISDSFSRSVVETTAYVGVPLLLLLALITVRLWHRPEVRIAALSASVVAILSMGVTIHASGRVTSLPVFALGLAFPLLQRFLPGRLMLYLTFLGWLGLARLPVLDNLLPGRLTVFLYLLAALLIASWLDELRAWSTSRRWSGSLATAGALAVLLPALPYPSTSNPIPEFFTGSAADRIPQGSVALVIPYSAGGDSRAMLWQEAAGFRFRMPEGYAFIPDRLHGWRLDPPPSTTQTLTLALGTGRSTPLGEEATHQIREELRAWNVDTVVVGPMQNEQQEVDLFTAVLGQPPQYVDGVYVWWDVAER